jgi:hypothetical protein
MLVISWSWNELRLGVSLFRKDEDDLSFPRPLLLMHSPSLSLLFPS